MCVLRCPTFRAKFSISTRCGISDIQGKRNGDVLRAFSGFYKLVKEDLRKGIDKTEVVVLKIHD